MIWMSNPSYQVALGHPVIFPLPRQIIIFVCLFCVYVVLQIELRPQDMPGKGLVAELHFQAKAPEI